MGMVDDGRYMSGSVFRVGWYIGRIKDVDMRRDSNLQ